MTGPIVSVEIGRSTWQGPAEEAPASAGERDGRASGQQVRALEVDDLAQIIRVVDGNNTLGAGELAEAILEAMPVPRIVGALTPAPQAATPTAQEAVPTCFACEDSPKPPNIPCAVCGAHPATPAPGIAEAVPVAIRHSFDGNGWLYADQGSGSDWQKRFSQYPDAEVLYDHPAAPAPRIADRLRHELTINPNLTFADAIEWVEYLANGGSDA